MKPRDEVSQSVGRLCNTLDYLAAAGGRASLRTLIDDLSLARTTAYDLLKLLIADGYAERDDKGRVGLGPAWWRLACTHLGLAPLVDLIDPVLQELQARTHECAQLSVLERGQVLVLRVVGGSRAMRVQTEAGTRQPFNWSAAGLVLLADMPPRQLGYFLTANARASPTGRAELRVRPLTTAIHAAREAGFAVEIGQAAEHAGSVAAPILGRDGECLGALCLEAPEARLEADRGDLVRAVREGAARLSAAAADRGLSR